MGQPHLPLPELLVVAAFSRHHDALQWARSRLEKEFGPIALQSPSYAFNQTEYYDATMGPDLHKLFFAFQELVKPEALPALKLQTNELENELTASGRYAEPRPLNLDPGLLSLGKLVLATTKDQAHRLYLRDGIFAEVTLHFEHGRFVPWPHTYRDYRKQEVLAFLGQAREYYRERLRESSSRR